ncbi:MAG: bifunctional folylpolyglutamate synthase/dihydrofolate synthase [Opitutales bacterium]|nr:bifunctional folylpolyglutamate synthase/dihydrofolate synthase [Opitutales bacterium]
MNDVQKILEELCRLRNFGSKLGLERMRSLMRELGNPQNAVPAIHIAGTNGKGSTAAMCEALLREQGLKCGLYTSPHLLRLGERIQVNREILSDEKIAAYVQEVYRAAKIFGKPGDRDFPSFFELMTAIAFLHFSRERCDVAVYECGLGGRLDATNILEPQVATNVIISSIGFDHCDILGSTYAEIATEKAGIIKRGQKVFSGWLPVPAYTVIQDCCRSRGAFFEDVSSLKKTLPETNLFGEHQRHNAALALAAVSSFCKKNVSAGALLKIDWQGRWQSMTLEDGQRLILDVAHNEECAKALDAMLAQTDKKIVAIVGVLGIERARAILKIVSKYARKIILVRPDQERACSQEELESCVPDDFKGTIKFSSLAEIFPKARKCIEQTDDGEIILVAGSCYLVGEALAAVTGTPSFQVHLQDKIENLKK